MSFDLDTVLNRLERIPAQDVLLLMACSDRKIDPGTDHVSLRELYDGPTWQTLRVHGSHLRDSQIIVLSGKHGWTGAGLFSTPYNERISPAKVDRLIELGASTQERRKGIVVGMTPTQLATRTSSDSPPWLAVVMCGGALYRRAFDAIVPEMQRNGLIDTDALIVATQGGIGDQRSQLGQMLRVTATASP